MNILELLGVDRCLCITSFKEERFHNMIALSKEFNIPIDFIEPIRDPIPLDSYRKSFLHTINSARGKYKKVLMFEDDVWTDLRREDLESRLITAGVPSLDYDILSLGSQPYLAEVFNKDLYRSKAFGYLHAVCFNLETLSQHFFDSVEAHVFKPLKPSNVDCAVSVSLKHVEKPYVVKESIFLQKNFKSGLAEESLNFNLDFRYTRDQPVSEGTSISVMKSRLSGDPSQPNYMPPDYINSFGGDIPCYSVRMDHSIDPSRLVPFRICVSNYYSGAYFYLSSEINYPFGWNRIKVPDFEKVIVEMECTGTGRIIHREVLNLRELPIS